MIGYIIIGISFFLDGILSNFLPFMIGDLSFFFPMLTLVSLFFVFPFFHHREKPYFITAFITGLLYDLFYTNLLFFNAFLFLLIAFIVQKLYRNFETSYLKVVFYVALIIVIYEVLNAFLIVIFNLVPMSFSRLFYKISHSLVLNIIYGELIYVIMKILPKRYMHKSIN